MKGQRTWTDISSKKIHKWPTNTLKDNSPHQFLGTGKLLPPWVFALTRVAIIKKPKNNRCWWKCWEIGTFIYCWWKHKMVQLPWKSVWWFLKKCQQNYHTCDSWGRKESDMTERLNWTELSNSTLRYTSKELKAGTLANTCACVFITALFTVAQR